MSIRNSNTDKKLLIIGADKLIKYAVLLSFGAAFLSLAVNWFLFSGWGLSYTSAVSTNDVIIGGLEAISVFLPHFLIGVPAYLVGRNIKTTSEYNPLFAYLTISMCLILFALIDLRGTSLKQFGMPGISITGRAYFDYLISWPIFLVALGLANFEKFKHILPLAVFLVFSLILLVSLVDALQNRPKRLQVWGNAERCVGQEFVVWTGTERIVTSCSPPPYTEDGEYFIIPKDGVQLKSFNRSNNAQTY